VCGCGLPLCPLPPDDGINNSTIDNQYLQDDLKELVAVSVTASTVIGSDGIEYRLPPKTAIRPGETFYVDKTGHVFRPKRKLRTNRRRFTEEDKPRDEWISGGTAEYTATGMSQTVFYKQVLINDYEYEYNLYDFVVYPGTDILSKKLWTDSVIFQTSKELANPVTDDTLVPLNVALAHNGKVLDDPYSVDRSTMTAAILTPAEYLSEEDGASSASGPIVDVLNNVIRVEIPLNNGIDSWVKLNKFELPPTLPPAGTSWPDPFWKRPVGVVTNLPGNISVTYRSPYFKRFSLIDGSITSDPIVETPISTYPSGEGDLTMYFLDRVTLAVDIGTTGRYSKLYYSDPLRNPYPIPVISIVVLGASGNQYRIPVYEFVDNIIEYGTNLETLLPSEYQDPATFDMVFRPMKTWQAYPEPLPDPPVWINTENYLFQSAEFDGVKFRVEPVSRLDTSNVGMFNYYGMVKVKVIGNVPVFEDSTDPVIGRDGLPVFDDDGGVVFRKRYKRDSGGGIEYNNGSFYVNDSYGEDKFQSWTCYDNGSTLALMLVNIDSSEITVLDNPKYLGYNLKKSQMPVMGENQIDVGYPNWAFGAFAHYNPKNNIGLIQYNFGTVRYGKYDAYNDSPSKRWSDFGIDRPLSRSEYNTLITNGYSDGKSLYEIVPPPYVWNTTAGQSTECTVKDVINSTNMHEFRSRILYGVQPIILPTEVYAKKIDKDEKVTWEPIPGGVAKLGKKIMLPGYSLTDETDDTTNIPGPFRVRFDLPSSMDGLVILGRCAGYIPDDNKFSIRGVFAGPVPDSELFGPKIPAHPTGYWNFKDTDQGTQQLNQDAGEFRSFVCTLDDYGQSSIVFEVDGSTPFSQLIILTGA